MLEKFLQDTLNVLLWHGIGNAVKRIPLLIRLMSHVLTIAESEEGGRYSGAISESFGTLHEFVDGEMLGGHL